MIIKWRDEYSCYDAGIDEQHKKLMDMINQMNEIAELNDDYDHYDEIVELFNGLKEYAVYHFNHEETLFKDHGYDSFSTKIQVLEHKSFVNKVAAINLYDLDENQNETVLTVLEFLSKWLDHHILDTDKKFGEFLRENANP